MNLKRILKGTASAPVQAFAAGPAPSGFLLEQIAMGASYPELPGLRPSQIVHTGNDPGGAGDGKNSSASGSPSGADAAAAE